MFRSRQRPRKANVSIPKRKYRNRELHAKDWDGTISDLTVHKATEEEVQRRRIIHKSKNASAARRALGERAKKLFIDPASPGQVQLEMRKLAILKEVLYDHDDLNEVLKRVDNTMSSVKTIFHEAPYRKSGIPNVTRAPGSKSVGGADPVQVREDPPTQLSLLSDSVMDKQALNDEALTSDEEDEDSEKFESKVDYERFLNVLRDSLSKAVDPAKEKATDEPVTPVNNPGSQRQALNCTEEVKRTMSRFQETQNPEGEKQDNTRKKIDETITKVTKANPPENKGKNQTVSFFMPDHSSSHPLRANLSANSMTYEGLQEAMESVANNLSELESRRGATSPEVANISLKGDGLAGFTATLIDAVTRLTVYVNEAEAKIADNESRFETLKNQNDHLRALVDALTAELMGSQELIKATKEETSKKMEESQKRQDEWRSSMERQMQEMKSQLVDLVKSDPDNITNSGDARQGPSANTPPVEIEDVQIVNGGTKAKEDEALKCDMLSLLGALKSQDVQPRQEEPPGSLFLPMNNQTTKGAAQTVASVESQLRHLQLQHAEAQNRLQELSQVAGFLAGKVAETERSHSSASTHSSNSDKNKRSLEASPSSVSIESGPITPHGALEQPMDGFHFMIPAASNDTDDSSMFVTTGGDCYGASDVSSRIGVAEASPVIRTKISIPGTSSSESLDISDHSFRDVPRNVPALLQSNVYGAKEAQPRPRDAVSDLLKHLNTKNAKLWPPSSFKPTTELNPQEPSSRQMVSSIQQTQCNLEDRIAELNKQHAEAQSRLHNLIRKRSDTRSPSFSSSSGESRRIIQVTIPTDDMLKTPQIHKPTEPFRPLNIADDSFV